MAPLITDTDRATNSLADRLAKSAAAAHRVPADIRQRIRDDEQAVREVAIMLARITYAANNKPSPPCRDSAPTVGKGPRHPQERLPADTRWHAAPRHPRRPHAVQTSLWMEVYHLSMLV